MVEVYARLIIAKKRQIETIDKKLQAAVIEQLKEWGYDEKGDPIKSA